MKDEYCSTREGKYQGQWNTPFINWTLIFFHLFFRKGASLYGVCLLLFKPGFYKFPILQNTTSTQPSQSAFKSLPACSRCHWTWKYGKHSRNTHACVLRVVRDFDSCRNTWVDKVQCKRRHPACSHVVSTHGTPKCHPVYGFRNATFVTKCPSLPIDCQWSSMCCINTNVLPP